MGSQFFLAVITATALVMTPGALLLGALKLPRVAVWGGATHGDVDPAPAPMVETDSYYPSGWHAVAGI